MIEVPIPYTTRPSMRKNTDKIFITDPNPQTKQEKLKQLQLFGEDLYGSLSDSHTLHLISLASEFCGVKNTDNILNLALELEEDIAIVDDAKVVALCFCFPSSWIPRSKLGLSLKDVHRAVADSEKLVAMSDKISYTVSDQVQGSFRRSVYTISNNSQLSNHPKNKINSEPKELKDLFFRTEIQTTYPLVQNRSFVFFVKVDVVPLLDVWDNLGDRIIQSVNSMTDNVLEYKNLHNIKQILNTYVQGSASHKSP